MHCQQLSYQNATGLPNTQESGSWTPSQTSNRNFIWFKRIWQKLTDSGHLCQDCIDRMPEGGVVWKNSDAQDTQLQPRKESSGPGCRLAKSSSRLGAVPSAPASQPDGSACSLSWSWSGNGGGGIEGAPLLCYHWAMWSRERHQAIKTQNHIGSCSIKEQFEVHTNAHCPWSPPSYSFLGV